MKKRIFSFLLALFLFSNSYITVSASSDITLPVTNTMKELSLTGSKIGNLIRHYCEVIGLWLNHDKWGDGQLNELYQDYITEKALIQSSEDYLDYLNNHLTITEDDNGEYEYQADSEMMNTLYDFSKDLVESYTPYYAYTTFEYRDYIDRLFATKTQYDAFEEYLKNLENNEFLLVCFQDNVSTFKNCVTFQVVKFDGLLQYSSSYKNRVKPYYDWDDWISDSVKRAITPDGELLETYDDYGWTPPDGKNSDDLYFYNAFPSSAYMDLDYYSMGYYFCRYGVERHRVYSTVEDYKQYSIGERPYYVTDKYYSYNTSTDNSTTINQSTIDNSITYGDVYNYITNNYENPDSLTEDQLRDILDDYLEEIKNNQNNNDSGGSGSGGSDDSGGSGLGGLLSGLGGLGDAILAILGKLIEYVGKALELLSGTVTKVIDIIPSNVTALLSGLFPFIPEEWLTIIELSLVLGVILGIVGMFKK